MRNEDDETPFIPPQTPQPFVSDGLTRHQIEAEEQQARERQGRARPPAPSELPPIPPPIQIKPLLPETGPTPIPPAPVPPMHGLTTPIQPVPQIEPTPDKSAPPKPFDPYDPTTKPAELPQSPMPFDPFDRPTWQRAEKAQAQDRTHKSLFGMIGDFVSRLFRIEKRLEVAEKELKDVWPPRITSGGDDTSGGTAELPAGEFQGMYYGDITDNSTGFGFIQIVPPL